MYSGQVPEALFEDLKLMIGNKEYSDPVNNIYSKLSESQYRDIISRSIYVRENGKITLIGFPSGHRFWDLSNELYSQARTAEFSK